MQFPWSSPFRGNLLIWQSSYDFAREHFLSALVVSLMASPLALAGDASSGGMAMPGGDTMLMQMTLPPVPPMLERKSDKQGAPLFDGYGDHHHQITTANPRDADLFRSGRASCCLLSIITEAIRSFREAARLDPALRACAGGASPFALGTIIVLQMPLRPMDPRRRPCGRWRARSNSYASPEEISWIEAIATRYAPIHA